MIYECERCDAVLSPGLITCPRCGEAFDEAVPADATPDDVGGTFAVAPGTRLVPLPVAAPAVRSRHPSALPRVLAGLLAALALIGTGWWLGQHQAAAPDKPAEGVISPAPLPQSGLPTDTAAHPTYTAEMAAFVNQLKATGVGAQWPAFGDNDVLVITPPTVVDGTRALWDKDTYQRLAQGVYGNFAQNRFHAGFSDTDSTTCFVIVSDPSGKVVAVDLMGNVQ